MGGVHSSLAAQPDAAAPTGEHAFGDCARRCRWRSVDTPIAMEIFHMTHRETLKDIYTDEMKDLWSANDQMMKAVKTMSAKAHDADLKDALEQSIKGIANHADTLEFLISEAGAKVEP